VSRLSADRERQLAGERNARGEPACGIGVVKLLQKVNQIAVRVDGDQAINLGRLGDVEDKGGGVGADVAHR